MTELEKTVLDAALHVFSRYGVKRTSMGDLCEEAGVSRQTLYNRFRNKDDILRGLIGRYTELALQEIAEEMPNAPDLGAQLDLIFDRMAVRGYDTMQAMPNAQDFIAGANAVSQEALQCSAGRFRGVIAEVLQPHEAALTRNGLTVEALADFIQRSAEAAGMHALDRDHFLAQLRTLKQLSLTAALGPVPDAIHKED
ncbi:TetR/AcrR family transcriptional regulator [Sulfitobacter sp.]|uniref:TetR/AcrR family transcriptional regulator n=1 Tax=Sulfitobacter sp. TaxID=1903071 RepID=UPI002608B20D|nr:TetR/AcrR family transcriptional regulator [Sulfitobacter sp.]